MFLETYCLTAHYPLQIYETNQIFLVRAVALLLGLRYYVFVLAFLAILSNMLVVILVNLSTSNFTFLYSSVCSFNCAISDLLTASSLSFSLLNQNSSFIVRASTHFKYSCNRSFTCGRQYDLSNAIEWPNNLLRMEESIRQFIIVVLTNLRNP